MTPLLSVSLSVSSPCVSHFRIPSKYPPNSLEWSVYLFLSYSLLFIDLFLIFSRPARQEKRGDTLKREFSYPRSWLRYFSRNRSPTVGCGLFYTRNVFFVNCSRLAELLQHPVNSRLLSGSTRATNLELINNRISRIRVPHRASLQVVVSDLE